MATDHQPFGEFDADMPGILQGTGLTMCRVCGGAEGTLPTHCPGRKLLIEEHEGIHKGTRDYRDGHWVVTRKVYLSKDGTEFDTIEEAGRHDRRYDLIAHLENHDDIYWHDPRTCVRVVDALLEKFDVRVRA